MRRRFYPAILLVAALAVAAGAVIVDRIVATAGKRAITLSEVHEEHRLERFLSRQPVEPLDDPRIAEIADRLINQALLAQEMESARFARVHTVDVAGQIADLKQQFGGDESFRRALREYDITEEKLRAVLEFRANVNRFLEVRFRPVTQVENAAIERYYRQTLVPQLEARQVRDIPALDEVRDRIEDILVQEQIDREYAAWIKEVREQANVRFRYPAPPNTARK